MLLQSHIKSLGKRLSTAQQTDVLNRRRRLESRITAFENRITVIMDISEDTRWSKEAGKIRIIPDSSDELSDEDSTTWEEVKWTPEHDIISLPSSLAPGEIERHSLQAVATLEAELRKGQISDSLEGLRLALGEKSLSFRAEVRNASSQRTSQRAWANVHKFDEEARKHRKLYNHARAALGRLSVFPDYLATLHDITEQDMKMSGDVTEENRFGQRSETLAWFWRLSEGLSGEDQSSPRMRECRLKPSLTSISLTTASVYRISWLRAKARYNRWEEEVSLVKHEMQWTVAWFSTHERIWMNRYEEVDDEESADGLRCYALKQSYLWKALREHSQKLFDHIRLT